MWAEASDLSDLDGTSIRRSVHRPRRGSIWRALLKPYRTRSFAPRFHGLAVKKGRCIRFERPVIQPRPISCILMRKFMFAPGELQVLADKKVLLVNACTHTHTHTHTHTNTHPPARARARAQIPDAYAPPRSKPCSQEAHYTHIATFQLLAPAHYTILEDALGVLSFI